MEIHDEAYVSLETAKLLKKAGFDWECTCAYMPKSSHGNELFQWHYQPTDYNHNQEDKNFEVYSAPTLALVQKWLREVKSCYVWVEPGKITRPETSMPFNDIDTKEWQVYIWFGVDGHRRGTGFTYEEALEAGINGALMMLL